MTPKTRQSDDSGAALILALVFITVVAVVVAVVMSFADTGIRTTLNLRSQATDAASADGAAQVAINALRQGNYKGTGVNCFGASDTLPLPKFYQSPSGSTYSAAVKCLPDTAKGAAYSPPISEKNKPGSAILTLGSVLPGENGINVKVASGPGGSSLPFQVHGGIFSNSNINVSLGKLVTNADVTARGHCTGSITSPTQTCDIAAKVDTRGDDPMYDPPNVTDAPTTPRSVPACPGDNTTVVFLPGLYTDVDSLNALTKNSGCKDSVFWFMPGGTYYFDFDKDKAWLINTGYLVGGTSTNGPTPPANGFEPKIPGACQTPIPPSLPTGGTWTPPGPNAGVQFVFGGVSRIDVKDAQVEVCGTFSESHPPIAVYGLKAGVGTVHKQGGCIIDRPYPSTGCPVITTELSPKNSFYVQGTTYVPSAVLDISLNNTTQQVFRYGVIARSLYLSPTGSADLTNPVIEVPDDSPAYALRTVVNLDVYICPGADTCSATGTARLRAKVGISDPGGPPVAGKREITVYTWSVQR
ncbi:MAG: hypothetical protein QOE61_292 [Micromonosporaceae bacterium]|nr:hypothetical protein [Micromonosporaceae bacterium]